jgi:glutaredoxin-like YruB-family protein
MEIKIYTTPTCGYCHQAKSFLNELGVKYIEYDVSQDRQAANEMVNLTGQMGVPVIVVDDQVIIGFDRPRLQQLIAAGGRPKGPRLGLKVADAGNAARKPGEPPVFGAMVGAVKPASPGDRAGLATGDIITVIGQKRINNVADLEEALSALGTGNRVSVTYYRNDTPHKSELVFS